MCLVMYFLMEFSVEKGGEKVISFGFFSRIEELLKKRERRRRREEGGCLTRKDIFV